MQNCKDNRRPSTPQYTLLRIYLHEIIVLYMHMIYRSISLYKHLNQLIRVNRIRFLIDIHFASELVLFAFTLGISIHIFHSIVGGISGYWYFILVIVIRYIGKSTV